MSIFFEHLYSYYQVSTDCELVTLQFGSKTVSVIEYGNLKMVGNSTGDVGFHPPSLKFKGKNALTSRQLQEIRTKLQSQRRTELRIHSTEETRQAFSMSQNSVTTRSAAFKVGSMSQEHQEIARAKQNYSCNYGRGLLCLCRSVV